MMDGFRFCSDGTWKHVDWFQSQFHFGLTLMLKPIASRDVISQPVEMSELRLAKPYTSTEALFSWSMQPLAARACKNDHTHVHNVGVLFASGGTIAGFRRRQQDVYPDLRRDFCWDGDPRYRETPCPHDVPCQFLKSVMVLLDRWEMQLCAWRRMKFWLPHERQPAVWLPSGKEVTLRTVNYIMAKNGENKEFVWLSQLTRELIAGADDDLRIAEALYRVQTKRIRRLLPYSRI